MKYKEPGYNRLLVADFFHWELDQIGNLVIKENHQKNARGGG